MHKKSNLGLSQIAGALRGTPCFVIGNAPSLLDLDMRMVEPFFTIGINRAYRALRTSILMWQDPELMKDSRRDIERLDCIRACPPKADPSGKFLHLHLHGSVFHKTSNPSILYGRGSSGPLAVQMADAIGCRPIFLLGMDCSCRGKATDFYGTNRDWKPHTVQLCQAGLKWISTNFAHDEVINLSGSPHGLAEAARKFEKFAKGRDHYLSLLRRRSSRLQA